MQDGFSKRHPTVPDETMRDLLGRLQYQLYTQAKNEFDKLAVREQGQERPFLADNRSKKGVVALPRGVQYRVIEDGTGASVRPRRAK